MITVFLGPSLPVDEARSILDAEYLPPAAQGDIYRASRRKPDAIVFIDGYFDSTPSVWHKEVLWALSEGIAVYGSSSMGALRAAELHSFGMIGSGVVFEWFQTGQLEDDDEVAVLHGDAASGYMHMTDAMVDIRANVEAAQKCRAVSDAGAAAIVAQAKSAFYWDRSLRGAVRSAVEAGALCQEEADSFLRCTAENKFSIKRRDASDLLTALAKLPRIPRPAKQFAFQNSGMWVEFRTYHGDVDFASGLGQQDGVSLEDLLNELRLQPTLSKQVLDGALVRLLALRQYRRDRSPEIGVDRLGEIANSFRRAHNLLTENSLREWCDANGLLYPSDLRNFIMDIARIESVRTLNARNVHLHVANELRERDEFAMLHARARSKRKLMQDVERILRSDEKMDYETVMAWYFEQRTDNPSAASDPMYFASVGFESHDEFVRAVRADYLYEHRMDEYHF